jgi:hypothetical protein
VVTITATVSEQLQDGAELLVTLNTTFGTSVMLSRIGDKTYAGSYTVAPGDSTAGANLAVTAVASTNASDLAGNAFVSGTTNFSTGVVIDAGLKLVAPGGFSDGTTSIQNRGIVTVIPIRFNAPVTGFTLGAMSLMLNGRTPISLRGASLTGSGSAYSLILPRLSTNPKGVYVLTIDPSRGIKAQQNGFAMTEPLYLMWGNGTTAPAPFASASQKGSAGTTNAQVALAATTAAQPSAVAAPTAPTRPTRPVRK